MKSESTSPSSQDLVTFLTELLEYGRKPSFGTTSVVERLERSSRRLEELVAFMDALSPGPGYTGAPGGRLAGFPGQHEGGPTDVLAQVMLLSQALAWGMWAVASGEQDEISLTSFLNLRDASARQFAQVPPGELLDMARAEITSAIEFLCLADAEQMGRVGRIGSFEFTAAQMGELLCAHLEIQAEQLQRSLEAGWSLSEDASGWRQATSRQVGR